MRFQPDVCPVCRFVFIDTDTPAICPSCRANLSQLWIIVETAEAYVSAAKRDLLNQNFHRVVSHATKAKELAPQVNNEANELIILAYLQLKAIADGVRSINQLPEEDSLIGKYKPLFDELLDQEYRAKQYYNAGLAFARKNSLIAARNELTAATMIAPWLVEPHFSLCKVFILLKQFDLAASELLYLRTIAPEMSNLDQLEQLISNCVDCVNAVNPEDVQKMYISSLVSRFNQSVKR